MHWYFSASFCALNTFQVAGTSRYGIWLDCWSCIFYFFWSSTVGSLWKFVNFFTMIAYIFHLFHIICSVFVCITTTTTRSISLLLVWLVFDLHGQLRSMHDLFWTAGGNNIIPKQAVNKDATVFFELYHSSRKSFIYVSSVVCCVCGVVWMFYGLTFMMLFDVIFCCSLFVARFIPIHSDSFQFTLLLSVETILHWGIAPSGSDSCTTGGQK